MTDPLSISAGVIAIATLAYNSSKSLCQIISSIRDAPHNLIHLKTDVEGLYGVIGRLKQGLEKDDTDAALSDAQKSNLLEMGPTLEGCHKACDTFKDKMKRLTSHSSNDRITLRDRLRLHTQEKGIIAFQAQVGSYKSTLMIALEFTVLKATSENGDTVKGLEAKIEDTTSRLTGQMQGLQIGLQTILDASVESRGLTRPNPRPWPTEAQQSKIEHAIDEQTIALSHCHRACMIALEETTKVTGHGYKYVTACNEARLLMGDLGNATSGKLHTFSNIDIKGGWVVAGNMSGESAKDFFK